MYEYNNKYIDIDGNEIKKYINVSNDSWSFKQQNSHGMREFGDFIVNAIAQSNQMSWIPVTRTGCTTHRDAYDILWQARCSHYTYNHLCPTQLKVIVYFFMLCFFENKTTQT